MLDTEKTSYKSDLKVKKSDQFGCCFLLLLILIPFISETLRVGPEQVKKNAGRKFCKV